MLSAIIQASLISIFAAAPTPEPASSSDYCTDDGCCRMLDPQCEEVDLFTEGGVLIKADTWTCKDAEIATNICYFTAEPTCSPMDDSPFTVCC